MVRPALAALFVIVFATAGVIATAPPASAASPPEVLINELANGGARSDSDTFFELRNWGKAAVDLTGWNVYRCDEQGLRNNSDRPEAGFADVVLEPGEILAVSTAGLTGETHMTEPFELDGFGLFLVGPDGQLADAVGVYPNEPWPTQSECTLGRNLPNRLNFALGESWQRVAATGDVTRDFIAAPSTLGAQNRSRKTPTARSEVVISEFSPAGPASSDDEFVELRNGGQQAIDLGGWQIFRCTASGRLRPDTLQHSVPDGTVLEPGDTWVMAGAGFDGRSDARHETPFADITSGVLVQDAEGLLVDRLSVSTYGDSACQDGDDKLPAILDFVAGESYQRTTDGFVIAQRTPGGPNATVDSSLFRQTFAYPAQPGVAISELATDPSASEMPAGSERRNYIELGNYGTQQVDVGGWTVRRCEATGIRSRELQLTVPDGTVLGPGATYLAARDGTALAGVADARYETGLSMLGTGVWLEDADGVRVDSVGVYQANEMDATNVTASPCTKGFALTTYQPDRLLGETFQRSRFTGVDADDFVTAPATPGLIDRIDWADPTLPVTAAAPVEVETDQAEVLLASSESTLEVVGEAAAVLEAWSGASGGGPLVARVGEDETRLDASGPVTTTDDAWGYPYQRFVLDAAGLAPGARVAWAGATVGRNELQLSVWDAAASSWRPLDAGSGARVELSGELREGELVDGTVTLLVQDGPRTERTLAAEADGAPENPGDYDFAISHITDTQYLSESYPEVYAQLVSWIAANAEARKIAFATHTGDLVQNWVTPDQNELRARREFERASAIQAILDDAAVPNSVLPGNHDNKRGVNDSLFNEYFGPERYEGTAWYGGSIGPGDNSANFSTFEREGARFLMLSLPYAFGDRELAWAERIVAGHPDHNVIISTHEHVTPKTALEQAGRSTNSRWVSRGQELWERVIAPNRNVVIVLAGHFHGLGQIVTENAGGIEGHDVVELLADYQEFRTDTGERATGFQRLLQIDLAAATVAVDSFSVHLGASSSYEYDYPQFVADDGLAGTLSNARPWRIVEAGLQDRYTAADDEFTASVSFQYPKQVSTQTLRVAAPDSMRTVLSSWAGTSPVRVGEWLQRTTTR